MYDRIWCDTLTDFSGLDSRERPSDERGPEKRKNANPDNLNAGSAFSGECRSLHACPLSSCSEGIIISKRNFLARAAKAAKGA